MASSRRAKPRRHFDVRLLIAPLAFACNAPPAAPPPGPPPKQAHAIAAAPMAAAPTSGASSAPAASATARRTGSPETTSAPAANTPATATTSSASVVAPAQTNPAPLTELVPPLRDAGGALLPQTDERPRIDDPFFQAGTEALFAAIRDDDPDRALPFFFPREAYEQVKAIARPGRDWETRLVRLFRRDVHDLHEKLGPRRAEAKFLRVQVKEEKAQWMKPGTEGNRLGYFRVTRSSLFYADAAGKERELRLTSLISWRGHWYLVHLSGFE